MTHALIATLTLTCMLCAQCMAILEAKWVFTTQSPASKQKEKQTRNSFLLKTEDKIRPGQLGTDKLYATLTLTCMHALCMAILEELPLTQPSPANRAHAHVRKKREENQARPRKILNFTTLDTCAGCNSDMHR